MQEKDFKETYFTTTEVGVCGGVELHGATDGFNMEVFLCLFQGIVYSRKIFPNSARPLRLTLFFFFLINDFLLEFLV